MLAGQLINGPWLSRTVTVKVHWLVLPWLSVAILVTVVTPAGKTEPLAGTLTRLVTLPQVSVAVTLKVTLLAHCPGAVLTMMLVGQVTTGPWLSRTVTVKVQVLVFPLLSVAVLVTVVTPAGKAEPLAGTLARFVTLPQASVAVTLKVTLLVH